MTASVRISSDGPRSARIAIRLARVTYDIPQTMSDGSRSTQDRPRRALVVAPMPYYLEKGSTLRVHAMVERLLEAGYAVDVVCYPRGIDPELSGVSVTRAGLRWLTDTDAGPSIADLLNDVFVAVAAVRLAWANDYDRLQGEDAEGIAIALLAGLGSDAEIVYDLHNPLTENLQINGIPFPTTLSRAIEGVLYRRADRILANWNQWAEAIRTRYGLDHVETVYDELPAATRAFELPADRYLAYVGNFNRYQGVDLLVDAFGTIAAEVEVDLLLVGEPTEELRRAVVDSPVADRIHLLGRRDIAASNHVIANAVATVIPRRSGDQPGTKLLHYTMHDPPIIATRLDCNRELDRFDNRVVWAEPTVESLADAIREVCDGG